MSGLVFTVPFAAVAITLAQDLFEILAPASSRLELCEVDIGQYSDAGDAQDELISIQILRGHTVTGSGGSAVTPVLYRPWSRASTVVAAVNNTTVATGGSPVIIHATSFNVRAGWFYRPPVVAPRESERPFININERLVVRITAPADSITVNGTLKFKEIGLADG